MRPKDLTRTECDYFRRECNFTEDECAVFDLLARGKSVVEISMQLNLSVPTVNRKIRGVKAKIVRTS